MVPLPSIGQYIKFQLLSFIHAFHKYRLSVGSALGTGDANPDSRMAPVCRESLVWLER